jgi:NhaA family Na+:H+ antiporter
LIWYLFLKAGIHPTIAGVLLALVTPAKTEIGLGEFVTGIRKAVGNFETSRSKGVFLNRNQIHAIGHVEKLVGKVQPYLQHLEHKLHKWVAFFIMPVFALANAGVEFNFNEAGGIKPLAFHVGIALLAGKVIGITGFSYLGVKLKLVKLPENTNFKHIIGISFLGGVGFTMALFINTLAYEHQDLIDSAKIGIIFSSVIAGTFGYLILKRTLNKDESPEVLKTTGKDH